MSELLRADPDLAVEEWLDFAAALGADCIELSAALHPSLADVPAEAMLDPVATGPLALTIPSRPHGPAYST